MKSLNKKSLTRTALSVALVSQLARLLAVVLTPESLEWQAHDAAMHLCVVALCAYAAYVTPYRNMTAKSILLALLIFEFAPLVESIYKLFDIVISVDVMICQVIIMIFLAVFYVTRISKNDDELDDTNLFVCRFRPKSIQGWIISMFSVSGMGGVGIYYKGFIYHYHNGILIKEPFIYLKQYSISRASKPSAEAITTLNNLIGTKWKLTQNCLTNLLAISKMGRPLFPMKYPTN